MEKLRAMTDPACQQHDGVDRIKWVEMDGGVVFPRRSGKAVARYARYRKADANSSTLAGFLELDCVGVAVEGHPTSVSSGDKLPVNFGLDKTSVMPTSNRAAVEDDRGQTFNLLVDANGVQFVNMNSTTGGVVKVEDVIDAAGAYVSVSVANGRRWGNL